MGRLGKHLRICGECGIAYASVSFTKIIDQCPICNSKRYEKISIESDNNNSST